MQAKKIIAVVLSLCMLGGEVSCGAPFIAQSITAQAETIEEDCYSFDVETGVLTLRGNVDKSFLKEIKHDGNATTTYPFRYAEDVTCVKAEKGTVLPEDCTGLFSNYINCTSIDLSEANTSNVTNMWGMFYGCKQLTTLDVSDFDTSNVTYMYGMFNGCEKLATLDISCFNTSNVTSMTAMFKGCKNLNKLDLSNFDTSNVESMNEMFRECESLTSLNVSGFDTRNVTNMDWMFVSCRSLATIDVSRFDTRNVVSMAYMFYNCRILSKLDVSKFDTSKVRRFDGMFDWCDKLTTLDVSSFDTSKATSMSCMFVQCCNLSKLDVSKFDTSKVTDMYGMFGGCSSLKELDVSKFDTSNVKRMSSMFRDCSCLTKLDVRAFDTSKVEDMQWMFDGCSILTKLDVSGFDTSKVTNMGLMFRDCSKLSSLDLSAFDTSKVKYMTAMFSGCDNLTKLYLSKFDTSSVTEMKDMFSGCSSLTELDLSKFNTSNVTRMDGMFRKCENLTSLDLSKFDTSRVEFMYEMFDGCRRLTTLNLSGFDTSKFPVMTDMFKDCKKLKSLTLGINFRNVPEKAALPNGYGWVKRIPKLKHVSGNGEYAVIYNDGCNTYYLLEAYQPTYPTKIKYEYNEQYHQGKFTWNKVLLAERYGVLVYLAGKWRVQTQDIPATTTSYTTPKNSIFSSSTYKVAIAAKVNGKWDTENAIKYAVVTIVDGSVDPRKYCSGNRSDATKHTLEFDGETYKCIKCDFIAHEPCFEDHKILNKDDYNTLIALDYILYNISSEEPPYSEGASNHDERILQLIGEIDKIRRKDEYKNKYSFSDSEGRCISKVLESDAYKSLSAGSKCEVDLVTINSSNYTEYNYWYGNTSTYIIYALSALSITNPYLCATLFWLNDITAPETFGKDNREMLNLCMSSFAKNFAYTIGSDYVFETNKSKITGDKKWERDFMYTMTCFCIDYNEDVLDKDKDKYDLQTGDTFVHASWGHYCEKCLEDPNHEDSLTYSEKRDHFKYTRYRRDTVWMRDGEILFYKTTD